MGWRCFVEVPDYFQGTPHPYGVGSTPREALADALEVATHEGYPVEVLDRIEAEAEADKDFQDRGNRLACHEDHEDRGEDPETADHDECRQLWHFVLELPEEGDE